MKSRPPQSDSSGVSSRLVDANRIFEQDVLLQAPRREKSPRSSIIGDKRLTARDSVTPLSRAKKEDSLHSRNTTAKETASPVVFDDPILPHNDIQVRREGSFRSSPRLEERLKPNRIRKLTAVEEVRTKLTRKIIYRSLGLLVLLSSFAAIAYVVTDPLTQLLERPIKSVAVEGQFQYFPKDRAMALIEKEIDGDFLQVSLEKLKKVLQDDPWVEHVYLNRRWPDTLVVKIAEQKPIARWDANGFLNQRGEIIRVSDPDKLSGLPWLQGNEINAREIMQQYQDLSTLLRSRGLEIIALKCDDKKSWRLTLKNDKEIAIGREQVMEKLRRFVTVYDKFLNSVWVDVKSVDVRYPNGVSVRWVTDSEMAKKYLKPEISVASTALH